MKVLNVLIEYRICITDAYALLWYPVILSTCLDVEWQHRVVEGQAQQEPTPVARHTHLRGKEAEGNKTGE